LRCSPASQARRYAAIPKDRGVSICYGSSAAWASARIAANSSRSQAFSSRSTSFSKSFIAALLSELRKRRIALSWT